MISELLCEKAEIKENGSSLVALKKKISAKTVTAGVIGLGYVGLPLIKAMLNKKLTVYGYDISGTRVEKLKNGVSYLRGTDVSGLKTAFEQGAFSPASEPEILAKADVILICVPTPLVKHQTPDMSYVEKAAETIAKILRPGQIIILESTVYPGATNEIMLPVLEKTGLKHNIDFFVAYSPEREDPGNQNFHTAIIPKVVGADTQEVLDAAQSFYEIFIQSVTPARSVAVAEAAKLLENIYRCVNIGLVNELKIVFDDMGVDFWQVIEAASTKPFGFTPFYPGPGIGGHCIPIDPLYLTWKSGESKIETRFIRTATEINGDMPRYVVERLGAALDERFSKGLNGSKILIVGLAYKKNTDDLRESPAEEVVRHLLKRKADLSVCDPLVTDDEIARSAFAGFRRVELTAKEIENFDAVMILTDHDAIDWENLVTHARFIYDTRNATKHVNFGHEKIMK